MKLPHWLLRLLPMWDYICPKCKKQVAKDSHKCVHCGEQYNIPLRVPPKVLKDPKALEAYVHKYVFPRVSASQRKYLTGFFTEFLNSGWEDSGGSDITDDGKWDGTETYGAGSVIEVASDLVYAGDYACKTTITASTSDKHARAYVTFSAISEVFTRLYIRWSALLTDESGHYRFIQYKSGASWLTGLDLIYDGTDCHLQPEGEEGERGTTIIQPNTWYCVEFNMKRAAGGGGHFKVWLDGDLEIDWTGLTNSGTIDTLMVADADDWKIPNHNTWVDCVVVADAYIGPEAAGGLSIPVAMRHYRNLRTAITQFNLPKPHTLNFPKPKILRI